MGAHISERIFWLQDHGGSLRLVLPSSGELIHGVNNPEKQIILFDLGFLPSLSWDSKGQDLEFCLSHIHRAVQCYILEDSRIFLCLLGVTAPI